MLLNQTKYVNHSMIQSTLLTHRLVKTFSTDNKQPQNNNDKPTGNK